MVKNNNLNKKIATNRKRTEGSKVQKLKAYDRKPRHLSKKKETSGFPARLRKVS